MMNRICRIAVCLILAMVLLLASASADVLSDEERYQAALTHLNAYLSQNPEIDLEVVIKEFSELSGYNQAGTFKLYASVMSEVNSEDPNEIYIDRLLNAVKGNEKFISLLENEDFLSQYPYIRGAKELASYTNARLAELSWSREGKSGELENAIKLYESCLNFNDATKRWNSLLETSISANPAPAAATKTASTWKELQKTIYEAGDRTTTIRLQANIVAEYEDSALMIPTGANIIIDLQGFSIDRASYTASDLGSVIIVQKSASLAIRTNVQGARITGGYSTSVGGGIRNEGDLRLECVHVTGNKGSDGGGIFNHGSIYLAETVISDNTATGDGAGIWSDGEAYINMSQINENSCAGNGGGIVNRGQMTVVDSQMDHNSATLAGGAAYHGNNPQNQAEAALTFSGTDIQENNASKQGGGIYIESGNVSFIKKVQVSANHSFQGAGIVLSSGTLSVQDTVVVRENKNDKDRENNVLIMRGDGRITVTDRINEDTRISVTLLKGPGPITQGYGVYNSTDPILLFFEDSGEKIKQENGEAAVAGNEIIAGWRSANNAWYYYSADGTMLTGWQQIEGKWYYLGDSGAMVTGWQFINNKWYLFNENGVMLTDWQVINEKWFYFKDNGEMLTGWQQIKDKWFYFSEDGVLQKDWQNIDGNWYYISENGGLLTDWQKINDKWYYFRDNGAMLTGWQEIGSDWYYFSESGAMATGWRYIEEKWYHFGDNGAMDTDWQLIDEYWFYFDESGVMQTEWQQIEDEWYYFDPEEGAMQTDWVQDENTWYYMDPESGKMQTGWLLVDGRWYYLDPNGAMATGWRSIDGRMYYFDKQTGAAR